MNAVSIAQLARHGRLCENEPMERHTSMRVGGPARWHFVPESPEAVGLALQIGQEESLPVHIVGAGSNLIVPSCGVNGLVVEIGEGLSRLEREGNILRAQAGVRLSRLAQEACAASLAGLAFAQGIPGTLGGGIAMNAGAYGGELAQCVRSVDVWAEGKVLRVSNAEMNFSYRHSAVFANGWVVLGAEIALVPEDAAEISAEMKELARRRREKQPLHLPSAGSVFKRPEGHFAGALIEEAGCKGLRVGGAEVSTLHAGFIVNADNATGDDVLALIALVQRRVQEHSGILLEPEVRVLR